MISQRQGVRRAKRYRGRMGKSTVKEEGRTCSEHEAQERKDCGQELPSPLRKQLGWLQAWFVHSTLEDRIMTGA